MGHSGDNVQLVKPDNLPTNTAKPASAKNQTSAHMSTESHTAPVRVAGNAPGRTTCADCGVIESTREITKKGEGSGIGAVGGAVAGNEVEKRVKSNKGYEVTVRLDDGSSRVISEANPPAWRTGDHVKIVSGAIQSNP